MMMRLQVLTSKTYMEKEATVYVVSPFLCACVHGVLAWLNEDRLQLPKGLPET